MSPKAYSECRIVLRSRSLRAPAWCRSHWNETTQLSDSANREDCGTEQWHAHEYEGIAPKDDRKHEGVGDDIENDDEYADDEHGPQHPNVGHKRVRDGPFPVACTCADRGSYEHGDPERHPGYERFLGIAGQSVKRGPADHDECQPSDEYGNGIEPPTDFEWHQTGDGVQLRSNGRVQRRAQRVRWNDVLDRTRFAQPLATGEVRAETQAEFMGERHGPG